MGAMDDQREEERSSLSALSLSLTMQHSRSCTPLYTLPLQQADHHHQSSTTVKSARTVAAH